MNVNMAPICLSSQLRYIEVCRRFLSFSILHNSKIIKWHLEWCWCYLWVGKSLFIRTPVTPAPVSSRVHLQRGPVPVCPPLPLQEWPATLGHAVCCWKAGGKVWSGGRLLPGGQWRAFGCGEGRSVAPGWGGGRRSRLWHEGVSRGLCQCGKTSSMDIPVFIIYLFSLHIL